MKAPVLSCIAAMVIAGCAPESGTTLAESPAAGDSNLSSSVLTTIDLGTLGGETSFAVDVNLRGTVVGWSQTAAGEDHAFRWTARGGMVDLGTLPGHQWSRAVSITSTGRILGESGPTDGIGTPVVWSVSGRPNSLPIPLFPGATVRTLAYMNDLGQVVGATNGDGITFTHAWIWNRLRGSADINDQIPGGRENWANRINTWGLVVGVNNEPQAFNNYHGFVWSAATGYRDLGLPPGSDPRRTVVGGMAVNDLGLVAGWVESSELGGTRPFRWTATLGFQMLDGLEASGQGVAMAANLGGTAAGAAWDGTRTTPAAWPASGGVVSLSPGEVGLAMAVSDAGAVVGFAATGGGAGPTHGMLWRVRPGAVFAATPPVNSGTVSSMASAASAGLHDCLTSPRTRVARVELISCLAAKR